MGAEQMVQDLMREKTGIHEPSAETEWQSDFPPFGVANRKK
jgi:hypothetical protein